MVSSKFMKRIGGFILHAILLLVFLLWTVQAVFVIKGKLFQAEVFVLLGLLLLAVLGLVQYAQGNDAQVRVVYAIGLINILALSLLKWHFFYIPLIAAVAGLCISFVRDEEEEMMDTHDVVPEPEVTEVKTEKPAETQKPVKRKRGRPKKK